MRIVIAGAGLTGLGLALALKRSLASSFDIVVADPVLAQAARDDGRAFAISASGRRMFTALGVWNEMSAGAQAITDMVITDSGTRDEVRPAYLTFAQDAEEGEAFAHMVWSHVINRVLGQACRDAGVSLRSDAVSEAKTDQDGCDVIYAGGVSQRASLLVAADGARSRLREQSGIGWVGWAYEQSGIVATIGHERAHRGRAVEHFLPAGPFAMLPLPQGPTGGHQSSIVWTEKTADVDALLALRPDDLLEELEIRFGFQLGALHFVSTPKAYPLSYGIARSFVGPRLALVGDAAHVIHPIAGQGLNLGLKDAAALAQTIVDAARLGLDVGSDAALASYQAARRFDTVAMGIVTDGLNRLFSNDVTALRLTRDLGLGLVDRMPQLKKSFIRQASGLGAGQLRLLRGEAI